MTRDKSIFIKNVYYMLSYAFTNLTESAYDDIRTEHFENIQNLYAAILSKGIALQIKRGLYHSYINETEDIPTVRGRIEINGSIRNIIRRNMLINCSYDELSANNILNQILRSTAISLISSGRVDRRYVNELKSEMMFFDSVEDIDLTRVRWSDISLQRNNETYRMLLFICRMITEDELLTTEKGEHHLSGFNDDGYMSKLYENFIREYYSQEYHRYDRKFSSEALQIKWEDNPYNGKLPTMQTDITLTYGNKRLIIDAKYYQRTMQEYMGKLTYHSANMYQIYTYVKNMQAAFDGDVSGMLLYARTDEEIVPDNDYVIGGNSFSVHTLDLNKDFSEISKQLDSIVCKCIGEVKHHFLYA